MSTNTELLEEVEKLKKEQQLIHKALDFICKFHLKGLDWKSVLNEVKIEK